MASWIYLFSEFTSEALLFELLFIFVLCAGYSAYWVLRKKKSLSEDQTIPAGFIRDYLNNLIDDANSLQKQLYGLLTESTPTESFESHSPSLSGNQLSNLNPDNSDLLLKFRDLETKLKAQAQAMGSLVTEKTQLEKELEELKDSHTEPQESSSDENNDVSDRSELLNKISELEGKLDEYSVIEDDLANLKRLQQENSKLKSQLENKIESDPEEPANHEDSSHFDNLIEDVEKSLSKEPDKGSKNVDTDTEKKEPKVNPEQPQKESKKNEDLISEFEKMLKS